MKKILIFLIFILLILTGLLIFYTSKYVTKTGNIIWISDPKAKGEWVQNDTSIAWWANLSDSKIKTTIIYLSPYREFSSNSLMKNDKPLLYANWEKFAGIDVLRISLEWEDWKAVDNSKGNRLVSFIAQQLVRKFGIDKTKALEYTSSVINADKSPTELKLK